MKKFSAKLFTFIFILVSIDVSMFFFNKILSKQIILINSEINTKLKETIRTVKTPEIIISGNSYAERGLMPNIISDITGLNTINIAIGAGSISLAPGIYKKTNELPTIKPYINVISIAPMSLSDNINDDNVIHIDEYIKYNFFDRFYLFKNHLYMLVEIQLRVFKEFFRYLFSINNKYHNYNAFGFLGVNQIMDINDRNDFILELVSKNLNIGTKMNVRMKMIKESLKTISEGKNKTLIYISPTSPSYRQLIKDSNYEKLINFYKDSIISEVEKYPNIHFVDFSSSDNLNNDSLFYDPTHLNLMGAKIFSKDFSYFLLQNFIN